MNELKEALVITTIQDDAWRRSAIDVEGKREWSGISRSSWPRSKILIKILVCVISGYKNRLTVQVPMYLLYSRGIYIIILWNILHRIPWDCVKRVILVV
jgi:hypothetical protein